MSSFPTNASTTNASREFELEKVIYICGACHKENSIGVKDVIRCADCGYRILTKKRTKRYVVFDCK